MEHEVEIAFEVEDDSLSETAETEDAAPLHLRERRIDGAQQERACEPNPEESLTEDAGLQGDKVGSDVGQFGHGSQLSDRTRPRQSALFAPLPDHLSLPLLSMRIRLLDGSELVHPGRKAPREHAIGDFHERERRPEIVRIERRESRRPGHLLDRTKLADRHHSSWRSN